MSKGITERGGFVTYKLTVCFISGCVLTKATAVEMRCTTDDADGTDGMGKFMEACVMHCTVWVKGVRMNIL